MKRSLVAFSLSLACACAGARNAERTSSAANFKSKDGTPVSSPGQPAPKGNLICENEVSVGTHMPKRVCRYQDDTDEQRRETQDQFLANPNNQMTKSN